MRLLLFGKLLRDVLISARRYKMWWLVPLIFILLAFALLMILATLSGPLAPLIYPIL